MPVLVTDALVPAFAPWTSFGVVVNESDWERTREILEAVPYAERARPPSGLECVEGGDAAVVGRG